MITLARSDQSVLGRWWWTVDRWTLALLAAVMGFGILLIQAATPAVAEARGFGNFYFVERHIIMLVPALAIIFGVSLFSPRGLRLLAFGIFAVSLVLVLLTLLTGSEIKGATRWLHLPGLSLQPSEFLKPAFILVAAWLFTRHCERRGFPAIGSNVALYGLVAMMLILQPDLGMTFLVSAVWFAQFFLAGLPLMLVGMFGVAGVAGLVLAYHVFPHVAHRIDRFIDPQSGDTFQIDRSMEAFATGGMFGTGPGEGTVKMSLPDAHSDFVFAVAGEELGLFWCLVIVALYAGIVLRGFWRLRGENNLFIVLAVSGLLIEFGLQAIINMASTLHLMPTKGMTLPFISYGGSSLWGLAVAMGMLLGLTRRRYGQDTA
ncbi:MAG: cell division protein FtsW [Alphaproteobacteria bacterium]|nr:cell division protein FtsW [Alphaproteobacteria bacterium]